jgi:hypothetical protein
VQTQADTLDWVAELVARGHTGIFPVGVIKTHLANGGPDMHLPIQADTELKVSLGTQCRLRPARSAEVAELVAEGTQASFLGV